MLGVTIAKKASQIGFAGVAMSHILNTKSDVTWYLGRVGGPECRASRQNRRDGTSGRLRASDLTMWSGRAAYVTGRGMSSASNEAQAPTLTVSRTM